VTGRLAVALFHTVHDLLRLRESLERQSVSVTTVPVPRHLSSDCGHALQFASDQADTVRAQAHATDVEIEGIHELES
jgi:hypothetical protein